jgi:hypothetical protein
MIRLSAILAAIMIISHGKAAVLVAEHRLPTNASSMFSALAGIYSHGEIIEFRQAQTFIPTSSGSLYEISFNAHRGTTTNADLRVSVTSIANGQPGATLASFLIPFTQVGTSSLSLSLLRTGYFSHTIIATESLPLEAGMPYALVFSSDTAEANYSIYGDRSGYPSGTRLSYSNPGPFQEVSGSDLLFRISATTIPEPHASLAALVSILMVSMRRRRVEQDGAGQPATRPLDKPEGGGKPQPEAEGRSR